MGCVPYPRIIGHGPYPEIIGWVPYPKIVSGAMNDIYRYTLNYFYLFYLWAYPCPNPKIVMCALPEDHRVGALPEDHRACALPKDHRVGALPEDSEVCLKLCLLLHLKFYLLVLPLGLPLP